MRLTRIDDSTIEILAPAKINLHLEVVGKRPDGYHELETIMQSIGLLDRIQFRIRDDDQIKIRMTVPRGRAQHAMWNVPTDQTNLIWRALDRVRREFGHARGMDIALWKGIPSQAGLGGGSSDAVAALVAGWVLWQQSWDARRASQLAAELGSDLNFFLDGMGENPGIALCRGRGEQVESLAGPKNVHWVVVQPPQGCSTAAVFRRLHQNGEKTPIRNMQDALARGNMSQLGAHLFNRLEDAACQESGWIQKVKSEMCRENVLGHVMSGSGAARFGLCSSQQIASKVARRLEARLPVVAFAVRSWCPPPLQNQLRSLGVTV